jgi:hypothetical protein
MQQTDWTNPLRHDELIDRRVVLEKVPVACSSTGRPDSRDATCLVSASVEV